MKDAKSHIGVWISQPPKEPASVLTFWTPVYEHHDGRALTDAWRIQFWAQDEAAKGSVPSGQIPDIYNQVRLYHVRKQRCVITDQSVRKQGIRSGDVLVLFQTREVDIEMNQSLLLSQHWPPHVPVELALTRRSLTLAEVPTPLDADKFLDAIEAKVGFGGFKIDVKKVWSLVKSRFRSQ